MALFKIKDQNLEIVKGQPFGLEKEIQNLTEKNLETIFGLDFVQTEFSIINFRIDTLAFDKNTKSFIIIEYKKDKNLSVIDQGYTYLSLLLNNKADFILEYNENSEEVLKKTDVDWSQSRVMFISPGFTSYQKEAINFKDLPIELYEIKRYSNDTVAYNKIKAVGAVESIKTISKSNGNIDQVNKDIKVYTKEELLNKVKPQLKRIIEFISEQVTNIDENIEEKISKSMINYYSGGKGVVWVRLRGKEDYISIYLRDGSYNDNYGKVTYSKAKGGIFANPQLKISESELVDDLDNKFENYLKDLLKQSYDI